MHTIAPLGSVWDLVQGLLVAPVTLRYEIALIYMFVGAVCFTEHSMFV